MTDRSEKLLVTLQDGIKRITINRPERRNSVDHETIRLLRDAIQGSERDGTRVCILTGAGASFCAGADLAATSRSDIASYDVTRAIRDHVNPTIMAMRGLPVPIIARVHGHAVGVGHNYALACDIIIASDEALFGQVFVRIGLMPDGGSTFFLPRMVGYQKAFELMATGEIIDAAEALRLGLINRVVPFAELDATVDRIAARLASAPQIALARIKAGLNHGAHSDLAAALEFEAVNQDECFHSADFMEGVAAFIEKRKAVFGGKA
ncbi:MAG TPA: enoyl-CoA hydratase [Pyrinomonadaceae bacterium]|jgi:2-(1,2-epoxy-1,2-dihydrophenyl)acetyl-CoA isomerase|nr:enoyl-CoA hydratase [Pyrinomonadaceae bacterium]